VSDIQPKRIVTKGRVHIGQELELVQTAERSPAKDSFFDVGRPHGMPAVDYTPSLARPGELPMQRLVHSLANTDGSVFIEDDGLCASYGIFGAPGSGKTHLLLYLLRQILALHKDDPDLKFGGLILDPKGALIDDVRKIVNMAGRNDDDLIILNTDELKHREPVNVIHSALEPYELGQQLVLAAQSAGVSTSDPYWTLAWGNLFGAALYLLSLGNEAVTLKKLLDGVLTLESDDSLSSSKPERRIRSIQRLARQQGKNLENLRPEERQDAKNALNQIESFFGQENENITTIEAIVTRAYSPFQRSRYNCYSREESKVLAERRPNFYDQIIEDGKLVLVSLSPAEPAMAKTLCILVKCLFQRSVLSRLERVRAHRLRNFKRPVMIACDEYSQIASEVPGQPMGDGDFFSQSRQNGCMGLLATQSVNVLQASSLKEAWRSVFSNFGAKIFMRLVDNETAEEATKLAGEGDWYLTSQGTSRGKEGLGSSTQKELRERKSLPTSVLTQVFQKGDAVVLGSLDGSKEKSFTRFVHVPKDFDPPNAGRREKHA
jgi:TraM recognition site of TraD and TraG